MKICSSSSSSRVKKFINSFLFFNKVVTLSKSDLAVDKGRFEFIWFVSTWSYKIQILTFYLVNSRIQRSLIFTEKKTWNEVATCVGCLVWSNDSFFVAFSLNNKLSNQDKWTFLLHVPHMVNWIYHTFHCRNVRTTTEVVNI